MRSAIPNGLPATLFTMLHSASLSIGMGRMTPQHSTSQLHLRSPEILLNGTFSNSAFASVSARSTRDSHCFYGVGLWISALACTSSLVPRRGSAAVSLRTSSIICMHFTSAERGGPSRSSDLNGQGRQSLQGGEGLNVLTISCTQPGSRTYERTRTNQEYITSQPEPKRSDMRELHRLTLQVPPDANYGSSMVKTAKIIPFQTLRLDMDFTQ